MRVLSFFVRDFPRSVCLRHQIRTLCPLLFKSECYHILQKKQIGTRKAVDRIKIGRFIAEQRKRKGLTQAQLAEMLDVSNKTISRWERGINLPDYDQVLTLSNLFEVDVRDFMKGDLAASRSDSTAGQPSETE